MRDSGRSEPEGRGSLGSVLIFLVMIGVIIYSIIDYTNKEKETATNNTTVAVQTK